MLSFERRSRDPLPTVPAVVLALLVALAATVADGVGAVDPAATGRSATRVTHPLAASGRVLASALSSVAERLEDDWAGATRRLSTGGSMAFAGVGHALDAALSQPMATFGRMAIGGTEHATRAQSLYLRRVGNLPPPAATYGA